MEEEETEKGRKENGCKLANFDVLTARHCWRETSVSAEDDVNQR